MKNFTKLFIITISITFNIIAQTPVEKYGALQVIGTNLCDSAGNPIQLRGLSTHGIQYFNKFYVEKLFASLAEDWNVNVVRLASYVNEGWSEYGNYLEQPTYWKQRIDTLINYAEKYGIYVIIDWHMLTPGDPNTFLIEAKDFWSYMSQKHGNKKNVLFEICNEPNDDSTYVKIGNDFVFVKHKNGVSWTNNIKPYSDSILPIIRSNSDNIVIVGTPQWASRPDLVIGEELNFTNIMYSSHFYAADHKDSYRSFLRTAIDAGIPLFVTEFGTQKASGDSDNDFSSSNEWLTFLDSCKISWVNWNASNDQRAGAIYISSFNEEYPWNSYSDTTYMKEAGKWIFNRLKSSDLSINKNIKVNSTLSFKLDNNRIIFSKSFNNKTSLKIYNVAGREILNKIFSGNSINITPLNSGVYVIKISNLNLQIKSLVTVY